MYHSIQEENERDDSNDSMYYEGNSNEHVKSAVVKKCYVRFRYFAGNNVLFYTFAWMVRKIRVIFFIKFSTFLSLFKIYECNENVYKTFFSTIRLPFFFLPETALFTFNWNVAEYFQRSGICRIFKTRRN